MNPTVRAVFLTLAVIGIVYGALVALVQPDFKKLVAYSSVSHLGFVMLGIFALTVQSVQGALLVMLNHGISTGALFLLIGMIYERRHTRMIEAYGGIARVVPLFAAILTLVSLSSIGLPGTNGFVGEFLVLLGAFRTHPVFAVIATTGVIFAAAYLLWAIQRILFNPLDKPENEHIPDLNWRELGLAGSVPYLYRLAGCIPRRPCSAVWRHPPPSWSGQFRANAVPATAALRRPPPSPLENKACSLIFRFRYNSAPR